MIRSLKVWIVFVALTVGWVSIGYAQTSLTLGNGSVVTISDDGLGGLSASNGSAQTLLDWPTLCVKACAACDDPCQAGDVYDVQGAPSSVSGNGRTIRMSTVFMADLLVQRTIFAPDTQVGNLDGHVRYLDQFTNETNDTVEVTAYLGSIGTGRVVPNDANVSRSHYLDDTNLEPRDRWYVIDDADVNGGALAVGVLTWAVVVYSLL